MAGAIRIAREADAAAILAIYGPFCSETTISFEEHPPSLEEMRGRVFETLKLFPWLVCESEGAIWGYAYASPHRERAAYRWSADVSVYIAAGHRRSGLGRALYTSLFQILTLQGFYNVYAGITLPNPGSVALHEALGFRHVGIYKNVGYKHGTWHDVGWWQRSIQPLEPAPKMPVAFQDVRESRKFRDCLATGQRCLLSASQSS